MKSIYFLSHKVIALATVAAAIAMGKTVTPVQAVKLIGWLEFARAMAFGLFPLAVVSFTEMCLSLRRIQVRKRTVQYSQLTHSIIILTHCLSIISSLFAILLLLYRQYCYEPPSVGPL